MQKLRLQIIIIFFIIFCFGFFIIWIGYDGFFIFNEDGRCYFL